MNFFHSALIHMKTRVCLKDFVNDGSLFYNTSADTSDTSAARVRHECDTSATRTAGVRHEYKTLILITTQVKTYFQTPMFTI